VDFDEVAIHFSTGYISPGFESCDKNEDYVRVHSLIHVRIKDKNEIKKIAMKLLREPLLDLQREVEVMSCQMVIDFIKNGRIVKTVAISQLNEVRLNQDPLKYYTPSKSMIKFRDEYLSFFE
jgi:hypothetical protein